MNDLAKQQAIDVSSSNVMNLSFLARILHTLNELVSYNCGKEDAFLRMLPLPESSLSFLGILKSYFP